MSTVLVVEDEPSLRRLARMLLEAHGYRVLEADSAEPALRVCEEFSEAIDLLLTDVRLPGLSGPELAARARALRATLRVLYMSGCADDEAIRRGAGSTDGELLEKPFGAACLLRRVGEALRGQLRVEG